MDKANINEPLDLQEQTRRDDVYKDLNKIVDILQALPVFPSLVWVWTFDVIRDIFENYQNAEFNDEIIAEGVTLKQIFDKFWDDVDDIGINMDLGAEVIDETIRDWMRENDFLVALDEDGWLE